MLSVPDACESRLSLTFATNVDPAEATSTQESTQISRMDVEKFTDAIEAGRTGFPELISCLL
jgi:hypothetical protein